MFRLNRVLTDPTPDLLQRTLADATTAANKGFRARKIAWPPDDYPAAAAHWQSELAGQWQWAAPRNGPAIAVAWWSDRLARKHFRVVAVAESATDLFQPDRGEEGDGMDRPELWKVYPDDLYVWDKSNADEGRPGEEGDWCLWAVCRCGASGRPGDLGWMGPWCTACHDRAESGAPLTRPGDCRPVVFAGHPFWVEELAFCPDNRTLLTLVRAHASIWVWDTLTGQVEERELHGKARALAVSPDGQTAAVCAGEEVRLWSLADGSDGLVLPFALADRGNDHAALAFSPDGALLASITLPSWSWSSCRLALHDSATGEVKWTTTPDGRQPHHWGRHILKFTPDGRRLALGWREGVRLWDVGGGQELPAPGCEVEQLTAFAFSPNGRTLAVGAQYWREDQLKLWDLVAGKEKACLPGPVCDLAFTPDGRFLATAGRDGILRFRDADNGRLLAAYAWHQDDMTALSFSTDGCWLASGAQEDRVKLWPVDILLGQKKAPSKKAGA